MRVIVMFDLPVTTSEEAPHTGDSAETSSRMAF